MRTFIFATLLMMAAATARAEVFPVIEDQTVLRECGDCHMAFPPQTLPQASWRKIMAGLSDHFGEDASIDPALVRKILNYHVANASDVSTSRAAKKWRTRGTPLRIIDAPRFNDKHDECSPKVWTHKLIRSKANCLACHPEMQKTGRINENISFLPREVSNLCEDD